MLLQIVGFLCSDVKQEISQLSCHLLSCLLQLSNSLTNQVYSLCFLATQFLDRRCIALAHYAFTVQSAIQTL